MDSTAQPVANTTGLLAVILASMLSGFAAVYFEKVGSANAQYITKSLLGAQCVPP